MIKYFQKSQISIFVIIATILVILGLIFLSLNSDTFKFFVDEKSSHAVREYVNGCLDLQVREGVDEIAKRGGWLYHDIPSLAFANRDNPSILNKRARGIDVLEKIQIPYWYYYDDSSEVFRLNIPEFDTDHRYSIKNQLKRYLDENLEKKCIQSFRAFDGIYDIRYEPKEINTNIEFRGEDIIASLNLPLNIIEVNTNNREFIENFQIRTENKLLVPYHMARDFTMSQMNHSFIEKRMLQFLTPYQNSKSRDLLPPFYEFRLTYDFKPWYVPDIKNLVKQIISSNIGLIQDLDTNYHYTPPPSGLENNNFASGLSNMYLKYYMREDSLIYESNRALYNRYSEYTLKPEFQMFFPMHFDLAPSFGNIILLPSPESFISILPIFYTEYVSVYEITTPILVRIDDDNIFDTFEFVFAIEANIDYNSPLSEVVGIDFDSSDLETDIDRTLICDPFQFISAPVTLNITDPVRFGERKIDPRSSTGFNVPETGVEDAIVTFNCKGIATCHVGMTSVNARYEGNDYTELRFRLPINCDPGTLEVSKFGYQKLVFENINPTIDEPINLGSNYMFSEKEFKLNVGLLSPSDSRFSVARSFGQYDSGFVIFENLDTEDFVQVVEINEENQYDLSVMLIPGTYKVEGYVIYENDFIIPSDRVCYRKYPWSSRTCETLPQINLSAWMRGGIQTNMFNVTNRMIIYEDTLNLNLIDFGVPTNYDELESMSDIAFDLNRYSDGFIPYFD